jgi:hypothetical protein
MRKSGTRHHSKIPTHRQVKVNQLINYTNNRLLTSLYLVHRLEWSSWWRAMASTRTDKSLPSNFLAWTDELNNGHPVAISVKLNSVGCCSERPLTKFSDFLSSFSSQAATKLHFKKYCDTFQKTPPLCKYFSFSFCHFQFSRPHLSIVSNSHKSSPSPPLTYYSNNFSIFCTVGVLSIICDWRDWLVYHVKYSLSQDHGRFDNSYTYFLIIYFNPQTNSS